MQQQSSEFHFSLTTVIQILTILIIFAGIVGSYTMVQSRMGHIERQVEANRLKSEENSDIKADIRIIKNDVAELKKQIEKASLNIDRLREFRRGGESK